MMTNYQSHVYVKKTYVIIKINMSDPPLQKSK